MIEADICTHPDFPKLTEAYGWDEEKDEFPPELPRP